MSEQAAARSKGKRVDATAMLSRMPDVPLDRLTPVPAEEGSAPPIPSATSAEPRADQHQPPSTPAAASKPVVRSAPRRKPTTQRGAGKPTALKLPPTLTTELRNAMIYMRGHGTWDASMSSIAQAGIRYELDRLKAEFGLDAFPTVE